MFNLLRGLPIELERLVYCFILHVKEFEETNSPDSDETTNDGLINAKALKANIRFGEFAQNFISSILFCVAYHRDKLSNELESTVLENILKCRLTSEC